MTMELPRPDLDPSWEAGESDLVFQVMDWFIQEDDRVPRIPAYKKQYAHLDPQEKPDEYTAHLFGVTAYGNSVCLRVNDFQPSFYVQMPVGDWENKKRSKVEEAFQAHKAEILTGKYKATYNGESYMRSVIPYKLRDHLVSVKLVYRKDFWGFNNGEKFPFIKITVKSSALFNSLRWYYGREKVPKGWKLYESNITPMLRLIHQRELDPCGWVRVNGGTYTLTDDPDPESDTMPMSRCQINAMTNVDDLHCEKKNSIAPLLIASFDIECTSSHGDFPVPRKGYMKLAQDLIQYVRTFGRVEKESLIEMLTMAFKRNVDYQGRTIHQVFPKKMPRSEDLKTRILNVIDPLLKCLNEQALYKSDDNDALVAVAEDAEAEADAEATEALPDKTTEEKNVVERDICRILEARPTGSSESRTKDMGGLPPLQGDPLIQIGTTVHRYGSDEIVYKHIITLKSCDPIPGVVVESCETEEEVLVGWKDFIARLDPDVLIGYNIFGFDMDYMWQRAVELECVDDFNMGLGRLYMRRAWLDEQKLASSALGSNFLYFLSMDGVVTIDMYKVLQRDQKLDSYKLDAVASIFLGDHKNDLKPHEIFEKYKGDSADRAEIARYCIQDCALVNRLLHKLKVLENNIGMGNVCSVPLSYLFMRGQGIKIFSLVAKFCRSLKMLIPVVKGFNESSLDEDGVGYEGAIVLPPKTGIYLEDPITVFDFSSLYPSSMIERDLSHDRILLNPEKYGNLQDKGIEYITVTYDEYAGVGDKKHVTGQKNVVYAKMPDEKKGVIPSILMELLKQRKNTRKKIEYETLELRDGKRVTGLVSEEDDNLKVLDVEKMTTTTVAQRDVVRRSETYNEFEMAVLDALQLAYKITANSLYGQIGSRTSPIYLKEIAACTTATGRERIMLAKEFMQTNYGAEVIYGDTDSIFCKFPCKDERGFVVKGREALPYAIRAGQIGAKAIKSILPKPQSLEYEKTLFPFIIFSKKRYVGNLYEDDATKKPKQKSMGIVLKRRDNAPIVKKIYGGIIDCLLNKYSLSASVEFLRNYLNDMVEGRVPLEDLVITKTLGAGYKDPSKIAHRVLADRMGVRDPGNKPQINDRIPFVYIQPPPEGAQLQGDRIEAPDYIREMNLTPDYRFYITNQIMKPVCQIYGLCVEQLEDYPHKQSDFDYWWAVEEKLKEKAIYTNDERKRQDKLVDLRIDMARAILFEPFLERLPLPAPPSGSKSRKTTGQTRARARSDILLTATASAAKKKTFAKEVLTPCLQIAFQATECEKDKQKIYRGQITATATTPTSDAVPQVVWKETFEKPKKAKTKSGNTRDTVSNIATFYSLMYEHAFRQLLQLPDWKPRILSEGVHLLIHSSPARLELKRAIDQLKDYNERRETLLRLGDAGQLSEFTQNDLYSFVADFLIQVPHELSTPSAQKTEMA